MWDFTLQPTPTNNVNIPVLHKSTPRQLVPVAQQVTESEQANRLEADYDGDAEPEAVVKARKAAINPLSEIFDKVMPNTKL